MFHVHSKTEATIRKLKLWDRRVVQNNYESFDNLCELLNKEDRQILNSVAGAIREHLKILRRQLQEYFPVLIVLLPIKKEKDDIDAGIIKGLCIYLNEDPDDLVQKYMVSVCKKDTTVPAHISACLAHISAWMTDRQSELLVFPTTDFALINIVLLVSSFERD
eukprot:superscaffoldBa00001474_g10710